ncbi:MAG: hypothetical protein L0219_18615, partial [Phycisphaerales bacterium]|nr:hypothetical protein [Phycisphaerales bacterium]
MPNLVTLVGTNQAEAFLRRVLVEEDVLLSIEGGTATHRLAQRLALELVDKLKTSQWQLVNSLDAVELYEALDKRFAKAPIKPKQPATGLVLPGIDIPGRDPMEHYKQQASLYYLLGLIARGRATDAVALARNLSGGGRGHLPTEALKAMETAGHTKALDDFLHELLTQAPDSDFWPYYVEVSAKAGQTERMLALARNAAANEKIGKSKRANIHEYLFRALLAADEVDGGVSEIRRLIELRRKKRDDRQSYQTESAAQLGVMLARLGVLLEEPAWIDEGVAVVRESISKPDDRTMAYSFDQPASECATLLSDLGRREEAETMLKDALGVAARPNPERTYGAAELTKPYLIALVALYHRAGRHADVITLLDRAPYWGVKDIIDLLPHDFDLRMATGRFEGRLKMAEHGLPLVVMAAEAMAETGRKPEAVKILNAYLDFNSSSDAAYDLLLKLAGDGATTRLDELFARDAFEERPLIWKAELLRRKNQLAEAETVARQAIAIDPSDGEQGPGNRMRVYAVLAEIRAARGDQKEADFLRGAVKAIRLSETADRFYEAGLLKRAVKMYQDSLTHF